MVNAFFVKNLIKNINKDLKQLVAGEPFIQTLGSPDDQHKGFEDDLLTSLIPFRSSAYTAEEYLYVRVPLHDQYIRSMDMVIPVVNSKGSSIQGIASFMALMPFSVPETYVSRSIYFERKSVPHSLVVDQAIPAGQIIDNEMISYQPITVINSDRSLYRVLGGRAKCKVDAPSLAMSSCFKLKIDEKHFPQGMFSIVPYMGYSVLIARDAGSDAIRRSPKANNPWYSFSNHYKAFSGTTRYIMMQPERGEEVGKFYMDPTLQIGLVPMLQSLGGPLGSLTPELESGSGGETGSDSGGETGSGINGSDDDDEIDYSDVRCPQCATFTQYSEENEDHYCWECEEYIGDM